LKLVSKETVPVDLNESVNSQAEGQCFHNIPLSEDTTQKNHINQCLGLSCWKYFRVPPCTAATMGCLFNIC